MRIPFPAIISACFGVGICAFGATYMYHTRASHRETDAPRLQLSISEFNLIDQAGVPATEAVLDGSYTLVGFVFTNCPGLCPIMASTMAEAQSRLADTPLRYALFSLDAERDTPEVFLEFAKAHASNLDNWTLLTGDTAETRRIVREDLMLVVDDEDENLVPTSDGGTMANILHPTRMILVGPDRSIVGMYTVGHVSGIDRLESDLRTLLGD